MDCGMPGFPVHPQLPEVTQTHVHWVGMPLNDVHSLRDFFFFFVIPYNWDHIVFFFLWLSLLSVMPSSFIHVATNGRISFFFQWLSNIYLYLSHHTVLIHSPIERYSSCSYIKATVNNAAMNMVIQISLWENDFIYFDCISSSGIMDHIKILF